MSKVNERIASALERIADVLEKQRDEHASAAERSEKMSRFLTRAFNAFPHLSNVPLGPDIADAVMSARNPMGVLEYLAKDHEMGRKIAAMDVDSMLVEISAIDNRIALVSV